MPFKSRAQRRKFAQLLVEGKIEPDTFEEWNRETGGKALPERVKRKTAARKTSKQKTAKRKSPTKRAAKRKSAATRKSTSKRAARRTKAKRPRK